MEVDFVLLFHIEDGFSFTCRYYASVK